MNATTTIKLCKGFALTRFDEAQDANVETLFAILEDGTVLVSDERKFSIHFRRDGWSASDMTVEQVKATGAEFIGNYEVPSITL